MNIPNVKPLHGYVMLKFYPDQEFPLDPSSGLYLARAPHQKAVWRIGKVIAIGDGIPAKKGDKVTPHELKVGDFVVTDHIFGAVVYDGKNVEHLEIRVLSVDQIEGVLEGVTEEAAKVLDIG